ncbi:MAG: gamma-glutamylcyclotransferase [Proteobacteria bacterium]|nr:MAG: gamma-glutamylcyclotransferase [Pseudomonadota bacterium]
MKRTRHIQLPEDAAPLWVFGYGSLMWNPGFEHESCHVATVYGLHRRLCVSSIRYRGTPERPGLVLGLDRGGSCRGFAFRVAPGVKHEVADYLEEREMFSAVYKPIFVNVVLPDGRRQKALTFRVRRDHPQYTPPMCEIKTAERVARSRGKRGCNPEYVINTLDSLRRIGFDDTNLARVARHLESIGVRPPRQGGASGA